MCTSDFILNMLHFPAKITETEGRKWTYKAGISCPNESGASLVPLYLLHLAVRKFALVMADLTADPKPIDADLEHHPAIRSMARIFHGPLMKIRGARKHYTHLAKSVAKLSIIA